MAGIVEIRNHRGLALAGRTGPSRYEPLMSAVDEFKSRAMRAAKKLKSLAEDLTFQVDKTSLKDRQVGALISFGGGGVASVAGIAGLFAASPLIPAAMLAGSVISVAGFVVSTLAGQEAEKSKKSILADVEDIFKDLELKGTHVQNEIKNLMDTQDDDKVLVIDRLMDQLREDMKALPLSDANLPRLWNLLNILETLREASSNVSQDWKELASNAGKLFAFLVPVGLSQTSQTAAITEAQPKVLDNPTDAKLSALDNQQPNTQYASYGQVGKVVYVVNLFGNLVATCLSIKEMNDITDQLNELEKARSATDRERIYRGVAASLHSKALDLEDILKRLSNEYLQL